MEKIETGAEKSSPSLVDEIDHLLYEQKESEVLGILRTMPRVDVYSTHGHTILGGAAAENAMQVVQYLIETAGMPVDFANKFGSTPLMEAACHCNFEIASYLVQHGANVHAVSPEGDTPLIRAVDNAISGGNLAIVKLLIENGADKDYIQPSTGLSLIRIAELEGRPDIVNYLSSLTVIKMNEE
jgi:ankyrin repeat protein